MVTIEKINHLSKTEFIEMLGEIFENSPWIANKAAEHRPYASLASLHNQMVEIVKNAPRTEQLELIRAHPNLGERIEMSEESKEEQKGAGLKDLTLAEFESFQMLNKAYTEKFQFPFIFAVKGKTKNEIHQAMQGRVKQPKEQEFETALSEIYKIALFRLEEKIRQ